MRREPSKGPSEKPPTKKELEKIVEAEIERWRIKSVFEAKTNRQIALKAEREKLLAYLNNFHQKLPSSKGRDYYERNEKKDPIGKQEAYSKKFLDFEGEGETQQEKEENLLNKGHTKKYIHKTRLEFLNDVEGAIQKSDVDRRKLEEYIDKASWTRAKSKRLLLPVWIELRMMGYSRQDLSVL